MARLAAVPVAAALIALLPPARAIAVPADNVTLATRACQPPYDTFPFCNPSLPLDERVADLVGRLDDAEIPALLTARHNQSGQSPASGAIPRLGIPEWDWGMNAVHGVQSNCLSDPTTGEIWCPTSFSNPVTLGMSFNDSLFREVGAIVGLEARALWLGGAREYNGDPPPHIGLDAWSPNINCPHDPRWGRSQEVAGEDPLLLGRFGAAYTLGLQNGSAVPGPFFDAARYQAIVTLKHWDAYSLEDLTVPGGGRITRYNFNAVVSDYALQSTYWPAFRAAVVQGGAKGVMCSYNAVNGVPTCASAFLTSVLRGQWGFDGYITSDSGAIEAVYQQHKYVSDAVSAACVSLRDGTTDVCSGGVYYAALLNATVAAGAPCNRSHLTAALTRTFKLKFQLGLFDPVDDQPYWRVPLSALNSSSSQALNRLAVLESMALLKNDGAVLPLARGKRVAVIGPLATSTSVMPGNYLGQVCEHETHIGNSSCLDSVFAAVAAANVGGVTTTAPGMHNVTTTSTDEFAAAVAAAQEADVVVYVGGNDESVEGEMHDRTAIDLPGAQHALVAALAAVGKPLVVVLLSGSSLDVSAERDSAAVGGILFAGYPGTFGGWAIAQTLFGGNDHLGGKLATTWYPSDYVQQINMTDMELDTGVGRGYRFYTGVPVFPFGWGLSLTTFSYIPAAGGWPSAADAATALTTIAGPRPLLRSLQYAVQVTNNGAATGDDVVFLFVEPMATPTQPRNRLLRQLLDYQRVHLAPGASATVAFNVTARSLAMVDRDTGDVVSAPGTFRIVVTNGAGARLAQDVVLRGEQTTLEAFPARQ